MITLQQPSLAINDERDFAPARMWRDLDVRENYTRSDIVTKVANVARHAPGGKLENIVICCHGDSGYLCLGEGFTEFDAHMFSAWEGLVGTIWIRACRFAHVDPSYIANGGNGRIFCSALAQRARCMVVASNDIQDTLATSPLPFGQLDGFEGLVYWYNREGHMTSLHRYRSDAVE